jgi:predicted ABC-type ATPase
MPSDPAGEPPAPPVLAIFAGPNGSGKSTLYRLWFEPQFSVYVNADEIARSLTSMPESERDLKAAILAERMRLELIAQRSTFAFETVFSRTDYWLEFISGAKQAGYRVQVYFVCTEDPDLNAARVIARAARGGHSVPLDKVAKRYAGSIRTALAAVDIVDEIWIYDNTGRNRVPRLLGRLVDGVREDVERDLPGWARPFF